MVCGCVFLIEEVEIACFGDLDECFMANRSFYRGIPLWVMCVEVSSKDTSCWDIDVLEDSVNRVG